MKEFSIDGITIKNRYVQAPLAGYTSYAMRSLDYKYGCGLAYSEMISATAICYGNDKTLEMLPYKKEEGLLALQLFGGDINNVLQAIKYIDAHCEYDFLDFNFGCPVPKVIKQNAGSSFLTRQEDMYLLVRKMVEICSHPVICKIRLGFKDFNYLSTSKLIQDAGAKAIAVHGRTQKEGFVGEVHYDMIGEIKKQLTIPVIANGNIDVDNIDLVEKITNADAFMFGRASMGYPKLFEDLINYENNLPIREKTKKEQARCMLEHLHLLIEEKGEKMACQLFRGIACFYLKGIDQAKELKTKLIKCSSLKEFEDILIPLVD